MTRRACNLRAAVGVPLRDAPFVRIFGQDRKDAGSTEKPGIPLRIPAFHSRTLRLVPVLAAIIGLVFLTGCAASNPSVAASREPTLEAVLPLEDGVRLFRLGERLHLRVSIDSLRRIATGPSNSSNSPNGIAGGLDPKAWMKLAAPAGPFRPVQAVPGQRGYFHLVDAASGRLCLYDADAALLSTFALPPDFTPFPTGRAAVFRGADGAFTFVDYASGEARQYADRQTAEAGSTGWIPRGKTRLPAGLRGCVQPAGSTELFCRAADGSALRFDGALNRVPAWSRDDETANGLQRAVWDPARGRWTVRGYGRAQDALQHPAYLLDPDFRRLTLPDGPPPPARDP